MKGKEGYEPVGDWDGDRVHPGRMRDVCHGIVRGSRKEEGEMTVSISMYLIGLAIGIGLGLYAVKDERRKLKEDVIDVYCCRCGKFMFSKDGKGQRGKSHGYCNECMEKELKRVMAERLN